MKCLETRTRRSGIVYRQYETDDGKRYSTYEIPVSVAKTIGTVKLQAAMARWRRGEVKRARAEMIREQVLADPKIKAVVLSHMLGITEARVRQIRAGAR